MITVENLKENVLELICKTSTDLPKDVEEGLKKAQAREEPNSPAAGVLSVILKNIEMARKNSTPICQDTGTPIFYVLYPAGLSTLKMRHQIHEAVVEATNRSYLRPNAVNSVTGENSGNNLGKNFPTVHFEEWEKDYLQIELMLKGGGCENVGTQYKLPYSPLNAGRDITGIKKVVLDAVYQAQGLGCAPGILGVGIGGDRGTSYILSKKQLFRKLDDRNENEVLHEAEEEILEKANRLNIGPMGFGGKTTILGVKMDWMHRLPASFFVSISYMCWADRRKSMVLKNGQVKIQ